MTVTYRACYNVTDDTFQCDILHSIYLSVLLSILFIDHRSTLGEKYSKGSVSIQHTTFLGCKTHSGSGQYITDIPIKELFA